MEGVKEMINASSITLYEGGTHIKGKKGEGNKFGFSENVCRGITKFLYIIKQLDPVVKMIPDHHLYHESEISICHYYKIGYASKPEARFRNFKSSNPFDIKLIFEYETPQPKTLEFLVHNFFNSYHHRGEWYLIDSEMMTGFIQKRIFDLFIQKSGALGYSDARMGYDHRMFLEETK